LLGLLTYETGGVVGATTISNTGSTGDTSVTGGTTTMSTETDATMSSETTG